MSLSTHVLDAVHGSPAAGVAVVVEHQRSAGVWTIAAQGATDDDGRIGDLAPSLEPGVYRLSFAVEDYFAASGVEDSFYPSITITFRVTDPARHYHVPILLSPFAYSTYRGS
jgi:5-hydroxyisourate hydrolase